MRDYLSPSAPASLRLHVDCHVGLNNGPLACLDNHLGVDVASDGVVELPPRGNALLHGILSESTAIAETEQRRAIPAVGADGLFKSYPFLLERGVDAFLCDGSVPHGLHLLHGGVDQLLGVRGVAREEHLEEALHGLVEPRAGHFVSLIAI